MKGERDRLMRAEIAKSVERLSIGMHYQMIFFSGPVWVACENAAMSSDRKTATVNDGRFLHEWTSSSNVYRWSPKGRRKSINHSKKPPLVALMEPKANPDMKELAKSTGGQCTIVEKSGMVHVVHSSSSPSTANSGTREHGASGRCRRTLQARPGQRWKP